MTCEEIALHLEPYVRGDLRGAEREWLAAHLAICNNCQQEAIVMEQFSHRIEAGLKAWIEEGAVPPKVAARLRSSVRAQSRPSWQRWAVMGSAVAAAMFIGVLLINIDNPGAGLTSSVTGSILGLVRQPVPELTWGTPSTESGAKVIPVGAAASGRGVTMTVTSVEFGRGYTGVDYTLTGVDAKLAILRPAWLSGILTTGGQPLVLRSGKAWVVRDGVVAVRAVYDRVPAGQAAVFTLPAVVTAQEPGAVRVPLEAGAAQVEGLGGAATAVIKAVRLDGGEAHITLLSGGALVGATGWDLRDNADQVFAVKAGTPELAEGGYTQELTAGLSSTTKPLTLVARQPITLRALNLAVDLPKAP